MTTPAEVRKVVQTVVGSKGDDTVFEYVVSILEDGDFEFGVDGEDAFEAFGAVLVGSWSIFLLFSHCPYSSFCWKQTRGAPGLP